jgi:hypothetical protein
LGAEHRAGAPRDEEGWSWFGTKNKGQLRSTCKPKSITRKSTLQSWSRGLNKRVRDVTSGSQWLPERAIGLGWATRYKILAAIVAHFSLPDCNPLGSTSR